MRRSLFVTRVSLAATLVVVVAGCDSAPPAPSPVSEPAPAQPAPPLAGMTRVTGQVVEPGGPAVPGAVITWLYGGQPSRAVTGATGAYELTLDTQPPEVVKLSVEKDGYEPSVLYVAADGRAEVRRDLHLHRILRVAVGGSVSLPIGPSDSFCGNDADRGYDPDAKPCRRIRVGTSSEGRLDIWIKGADVERYRIQLAADPQQGGRSYFSAPVEAGSETVLDLLLMDSNGPVVAVLETRLAGWWDY
jgi:hypothetical protein